MNAANEIWLSTPYPVGVMYRLCRAMQVVGRMFTLPGLPLKPHGQQRQW